MKHAYRAFFVIAFFVGLALYVSGMDWAVFNPKGIIALKERNLIIATTLLMLIVVVPVYILIFAFGWRYRASNKKAKYTPNWQSNRTLEIIWWAIPAVIISILGYMTWQSSHALDPYRTIEGDRPPLTIQAVALDWKWLFIYPDEGIATVNYVQFPAGTPINFEITADAPMNSFWIPELGGMVYAMPGMQTKLHLMADTSGTYPGLSSNYSGAGFSGMKFTAKSTTEDEFLTWVQKVRHSPNALSRSGYTQLAKPSKNNPVDYYASVEKDLYNDIIMKYMMPHADTLKDNARTVDRIAPRHPSF